MFQKTLKIKLVKYIEPLKQEVVTLQKVQNSSHEQCKAMHGTVLWNYGIKRTSP